MMFLLAACNVTVRFPPEELDSGWLDTGWDTTVPLLPVIDDPTLSFSCSKTAWSWRFRTEAWTSKAELSLTDGTKTEAHTFALSGSSPTATWDAYALGLTPSKLYEPSVSTGLKCDSPLGHTIRLYDRLNANTDCVVFGAIDQIPDGCRTVRP